MNELVYAMEDLSLSKELKVYMNKGETEGPQGKFEEASSSVKNEWQEPEKDDSNFANKARKKNDFVKNYHNDNKSKWHNTYIGP